MTVLWLVLIFLVFCCIVAYLVRREEKRQFRIAMGERLTRIAPMFDRLSNAFMGLVDPIVKANEAIKKLGLALSKVQDKIEEGI